MRVVVPGVAGCRSAKWVSWDQILVHSASICIGFFVLPVEVGCCSVKWLVRNPQIYPHDCPEQLAKIVASDEESHSFWQRRDYKAFSPSTDWDNVDWDAGGWVAELLGQ